MYLQECFQVENRIHNITDSCCTLYGPGSLLLMRILGGPFKGGSLKGS